MMFARTPAARRRPRTCMADQAFEDESELHERGAVDDQLEESRVQEHRGHEPPPLAVRRLGPKLAPHETRASGSLPADADSTNRTTFRATSAGMTAGHGVRWRNASRKGSGSARRRSASLFARVAPTMSRSFSWLRSSGFIDLQGVTAEDGNDDENRLHNAEC